MDSTNDQPVPEALTVNVAESDVGMRVDAFLAAKIDGWSRARLQRLIEDGEILINGKTAKVSYKIQQGDQIEVDLIHSPLESFTPENIPLSIVFEDDELMVVNKPAGLVVHPAAGVQSGTLANALAYHFENLSTRGGATRPGIVHRLDKGTSGLMVVAKTETAHEHLADQFRAREIFKSYLALVHGIVKADAGRIEQPIARDPHNRTRMAIIRAGRGAVSLFKVRRRYDAFSLLDVEIKTGRTHQIRVHLASIKHPVVGDEVYGGGRDNNVRNVAMRNQIRKVGRQFLHAEQLGFTHPKTKERLRFTAGIPDELTQLLEYLE